MKKSFVFLLLALAVVVLVSPRIVGRLAEQSMDQNLDWAATETQEISVTSLGFDRGWFSSEGQHRVELKDGELRDSLLQLALESGYDELPALIIDTRIDHGLVPVTSMSRDKGSLAPGLGSAVSTLSLEFEDGESVALPGTIYSEVGLAGELTSNYITGPGSYAQGDESAIWGDIDVSVTTSPSNDSMGIDGRIDELVFTSLTEEFSFSGMTFVGEHRSTAFGFGIGDADIEIASITIPSTFGTDTFGPVTLRERIWLDGDAVSAQGTVTLNDIPFGELDRANITIDIAVDDADAAAIGRLSKRADEFDGPGNEWMLDGEQDLIALFAGGLAVRVNQLDVELPRGNLSATAQATLEEGDPNEYYWTSAMLLLEAELDLRISQELMDYVISLDPQANAVVGMGFLVPDGDDYVMSADVSDGLLTINGAPMPLSGLLQGGN